MLYDKRHLFALWMHEHESGKDAMRRMSFRLLFVFIVLAMLLTPSIVRAQENQPTDDEVNAIAKKLYCPVCENIPLDACGTQACIDWRAEIRKKLAEGWSEEEIIQYFVDQHGAQVLSTPPPEGLNLLVYIIPPVVFIVGAVILLRVLRSWRRETVAVEASSQLLVEEDPYVARLEDELQRRMGDS